LETLRLTVYKSSVPTRFDFIPKFVKLRVLDIRYPGKGDDYFELIGKHCPDLR
jgi:hypothetical protein